MSGERRTAGTTTNPRKATRRHTGDVRHEGFTVRPIPQTAPQIISADDAWLGPAPYAQEALALDFFPPGDEDFDRRPTRTSLLPDPTPFVARLSQAIVEVVSGQRPAPQLIRHTAPSLYSVLARQAMVAARRQRQGPRRPAVVRRVRLCEPADGIVEACAVVVSHGRVRALALRLEGLDGRWLVTALTIG
ncbi:3-hydroxyacyl-CoA dehydrogenase [Intrasporangium oryzae NRRL B-24470]|uniref:3-hydroxyacyl-CoA dehydrogenase n=1 Tax=Intrasporangium oryzae NRRL B-24470 TaxID=1386089 RepID=W9G482_9MICO|nr:Rv3235 family protein [Intrasporangium oryzae]EWT00830.1 3-hydroxyacyl-CoA dehydrogenase [Intrasporangium oryzae NRRL B-24470]